MNSDGSSDTISRMEHTPIRVVIIGGGFFGSKRLEACLSLPNSFTVVAIVDPSEPQRAKIKEMYGLPTYKTLDDFPDLADLAIIATPNSFHADASISALKKGMHILCEKPLSTNTRDAKRIVRMAKKYKRLVKMGSNHRFFYSLMKAREEVEAGTIGKLLHFKGSIGSNGSRVSGKWFWNKALSGGGTFIDNGSHLVDIARMFMGNFERVTASMETNMWNSAGVEDMGTAIFRTQDGRQAIISSSWYQWAGYLHIELWGDKGYIIIDSHEKDIVTIGDISGGSTVYDYSEKKRDSYQRELMYVAACIKKNEQPSPNAEDGKEVIALIESAYKAANRKRWTHVS